MGELLLALQAASILVPTIEGTIQVIAGATSETDPAPLTSDEANAVLNELNEAAKVAPVIAGLVPLVQQAFAGGGFNDQQLASLKATADAIDAEVSAKATAIENQGTAAENQGTEST